MAQDWTGTWQIHPTTDDDKCCYPTSHIIITHTEGEAQLLGAWNINKACEDAHVAGKKLKSEVHITEDGTPLVIKVPIGKNQDHKAVLTFTKTVEEKKEKKKEPVKTDEETKAGDKKEAAKTEEETKAGDKKEAAKTEEKTKVADNQLASTTTDEETKAGDKKEAAKTQEETKAGDKKEAVKTEEETKGEEKKEKKEKVNRKATLVNMFGDVKCEANLYLLPKNPPPPTPRKIPVPVNKQDWSGEWKVEYNQDLKDCCFPKSPVLIEQGADFKGKVEGEWGTEDHCQTVGLAGHNLDGKSEAVPDKLKVTFPLASGGAIKAYIKHGHDFASYETEDKKCLAKWTRVVPAGKAGEQSPGGPAPQAQESGTAKKDGHEEKGKHHPGDGPNWWLYGPIIAISIILLGALGWFIYTKLQAKKLQNSLLANPDLDNSVRL